MKVLWLGHNLCYPPKGGALQRNYNLVREISRKCEIHVLAFDQPVTRPFNVAPQDCVDALSRFCASVDWVPLEATPITGSRYVLALRSILSQAPYDFTWLRSVRMASKLENLIRRLSPDVVHFDALGLAQYLPLVGTAGTVLNHHDVESCKIKLRAKKSGNPFLRRYFTLEAAKLAVAERKWCPQFGVNTVVSEEEATVLASECSTLNVRIVPNGVDTTYFSPRPDPGSKVLLFCGSLDMHPNQEGIEYFISKVWPRIAMHDTEVECYVVGRKPPEWLERIGKVNSRVHVTGFVDDVRPYFQKAAVCVCPILSGGGTRLKILDSLAMGVPVVATPFAASGLSLDHGKHLLLANTESQFAESILHLLASKSLRMELSSNGATLVDRMYSWTVVADALMGAYRDVAMQRNCVPGRY